MLNVAELIKGTLVFVTNCVFGLLILLSNFWRPNAAVEIYLRRRADEVDKWPDGRVILFLAILVYQTAIFDQLVSGINPLAAYGAIALGAGSVPQTAIVATVIGYAILEGIMLLAPWAILPDQGPTRPNERARLLIATCILAASAWFWLVAVANNAIITGWPRAFAPGSAASEAMGIATVLLVIVPLVAISSVMGRNEHLMPKERSNLYPWSLVAVFVFTPMCASILLEQFAPVAQPRLRQVACAVNGDGTGTLDATVANDGEGAWALPARGVWIAFLDTSQPDTASLAVTQDADIAFAQPTAVRGAIYVRPRSLTPIRLTFRGVDPRLLGSPSVGCVLLNGYGPTVGPLPGSPVDGSLDWRRTTADFERIGSVSVTRPAPPRQSQPAEVPPPPAPD